MALFLRVGLLEWEAASILEDGIFSPWGTPNSLCKLHGLDIAHAIQFFDIMLFLLYLYYTIKTKNKQVFIETLSLC